MLFFFATLGNPVDGDDCIVLDDDNKRRLLLCALWEAAPKNELMDG